MEPNAIDTATQTLYYCEDARLPALARQAIAYGKGWQWEEVERILDRMYGLAGVENPASGYEFHTGTHPVWKIIDILAAS